jgi:2-polyprenyl-3-methyl-5-hydroxy-6-metoxy-1,4-benzoquinol methylase
MDTTKKEHWEKVFTTKKENEVSWFQKKPETSLNFFQEYGIPTDARILEIGGGDSYLIDFLLELGYENLTLLDISENAILRIQERLGKNAEKVNFIVSDISDFNTDEKFDIIHDRASFHFITQEKEIKKYGNLISKIISENGFYFVGTFSESGPLKCSGLEITQYSEEKFEDVFGDNLEKLKCFTEDHQTPFDTSQNFIFCIFRKKIQTF